jgi:hypothetical protein
MFEFYTRHRIPHDAPGQNSPAARRAFVRERIRREVQEEFEQKLRQSSGVHRWWLILRREMKISRRARQVIHENYDA